MKNKILKFVKEEILSTAKTTNDLVYKDKIIDQHNIIKSYESLCEDKNKNFIKFDILFNGVNYYANIETVLKIDRLHAMISNIATRTVFDEVDGEDKLIHNFKESEIFNSLWAEGIKSSKKVITQVRKNTNLFLEDGSAKKFISNYNNALEISLNTNDFNETIFFAMYTILSKDIDMGNETLDGYPYRRDQVQIGIESNTGMHPPLIKEAMDNLFKFVSQFDNAPLENKKGYKMITVLLLHYHFELIHPYYDMNGRMGRLMCLWLATKWKIPYHILFLSEAVNLFKHDFYYPAFKKSKFTSFKTDATFFISSMLCALISQKIIHLIVKNTNEIFKSKIGKRFSKIQKDIVKSLLSKEIKFYKIKNFIIGYEDMNQATISQALSSLVKEGILKSTNTKPKEYQVIWNDNMDKILDTFKNEWHNGSID